MSEMWAMLRDPRLSALLAWIGLGMVGLVLLLLGYQGIDSTEIVPLQMPYLVSGGLAGVAVVGVACTLVSVQLDRIEAAIERESVGDLQRETLRLLTLATERRARGLGRD